MNILATTVSTVFSIIASVVMLIVTRRITKRDKLREQHAKIQQCESMLNMKLQIAILKLSEANAIALRDGKTNGELKAAMAECATAKKAYYEFLDKQAYEHIAE